MAKEIYKKKAFNLGTQGSRELESMTIMAGSMAAAGTRAVAESLQSDPQA